jgi:Na+/H+ antiporter NhaD/arsenite permease-like protein
MQYLLKSMLILFEFASALAVAFSHVLKSAISTVAVAFITSVTHILPSQQVLNVTASSLEKVTHKKTDQRHNAFMNHEVGWA